MSQRKKQNHTYFTLTIKMHTTIRLTTCNCDTWNEHLPTYCFTTASVRLHEISCSAKTFKASFCVKTHLAAHSRDFTLINICKNNIRRILTRIHWNIHHCVTSRLLGLIKVPSGCPKSRFSFPTSSFSFSFAQWTLGSGKLSTNNIIKRLN